jgi:hypothetical protein
MLSNMWQRHVDRDNFDMQSTLHTHASACVHAVMRSYPVINDIYFTLIVVTFQSLISTKNGTD